MRVVSEGIQGKFSSYRQFVHSTFLPCKTTFECMKTFVVRAAVALSIVGALAFSTPLWASAGSTSSSTGTQSKAMRTYDKEIVAYRESRQAIQLTFRAAVNSAHASYEESLSVATSSAQRSAAQQAMVTAIIQAAAARSAALTALGSQPVKP
jgi:hypothetical protein